jgi:hypothetical protein
MAKTIYGGLRITTLGNSKAMTSDGSGNMVEATTTAAELDFLAGTTSGVQSQLDTLSSTISNFEWQPSVATVSTLDPTPLTPSTGDRYLINGTGAGAWAGQDNNIAEWNGSSWDFTTPTTGTMLSADDEGDKLYLYGGASWSAKNFEATTASTGLTKSGFDIQLDSSSAGTALSFSSGTLSVSGVTDSEVDAAANIAHSKMAALTASRAMTTDGSGKSTVATTTAAELDFLSGVTSAVQTQIDSKAGTALDNLSVGSLAAESLLVGSSSSAVSSLAAGSNGDVLTVTAGVVGWSAPVDGLNRVTATWALADGVSKAVAHGLGTKDVQVIIYDKATDESIFVDSVVRTDANTVTVTASEAPNASGWEVVIIG